MAFRRWYYFQLTESCESLQQPGHLFSKTREQLWRLRGFDHKNNHNNSETIICFYSIARFFMPGAINRYIFQRHCGNIIITLEFWRWYNIYRCKSNTYLY